MFTSAHILYTSICNSRNFPQLKRLSRVTSIQSGQNIVTLCYLILKIVKFWQQRTNLLQTHPAFGFWARSRSCKNHRLWLCSACNLKHLGVHMGQPGICSNHLRPYDWWVVITTVFQGVSDGFGKLKGLCTFLLGIQSVYMVWLITVYLQDDPPSSSKLTNSTLRRVPNQRTVICIGVSPTNFGNSYCFSIKSDYSLGLLSLS